MNGIDACHSQEGSVARIYDLKKGRRLEYFTLGWNLIEAGVAVAAGTIAGSIALIGFGVDSLIESLSGGILLWRLQLHEADEQRERIAAKLVGISFFVLAAYVAFDAAKTLVMREEPHVSTVGIVLACASLVVMPLLARAKRRVAALSGEPFPGSGLAADRSVRLPVCYPARRSGSERPFRLVVGRPHRRVYHGSDNCS